MARPPTPIRKTDTIDAAFVARVEALGFDQVGRTDEYRGHCLNPDHPDEHPSCDINVRKRVAICRSCKNTWSSAELTATLDLLERMAGAAATAPQRDHRAARGPTIATHDYVDAAGALVFQVVQYATPPNTPKDFSLRRRGARPGVWIDNVNGVIKVPFHLPMVTKAIAHGAPIVFVEGEKCAKALAALKIVATTTAGGANAWQDGYASHFAGADVIIWPDHDAPGHGYAVAVATGLLPIARRVRWVDSTGDLGDDVVDFLAANGADAVRARLESARPIGSVREIPPSPHARKIVAVGWQDLVAHPFQPREPVLGPWLLSQGTALVYAWRGVGKTSLLLGVAFAIATGSAFLRWKAPRARRVLYIDGELPGAELADRLRRAAAMLPSGVTPPDNDMLRVITPDTQDALYAPNLASEDAQRNLAAHLEGVDVVIFDSISTLWRGDENEAESWDSTQSFVLQLRQRGLAVVLVHHAGKAGTQRGTSKREDIMDTVVKLSRPEGHDPADGAHFKIEFEKNRHFWGDGARTFEAWIEQPTGAGAPRWRHGTKADADAEALIALVREGKSKRQAAKAVGMPWTTARRRLSLKPSTSGTRRNPGSKL